MGVRHRPWRRARRSLIRNVAHPARPEGAAGVAGVRQFDQLDNQFAAQEHERQRVEDAGQADHVQQSVQMAHAQIAG